MSDLRTRLRQADRISAPDLWPDIVARNPGPPPPGSPLARAVPLAVAAAIASLVAVLLVRVLPIGENTPGPAPSPSGLAEAGRVAGTVDFDGTLMAAAGGRLYAVGQLTERGYTIARVERDGSVAKAHIRDSLSSYLGRIAATPDAVYLGTDVIHRFSDASDEIIRIDAATLRVTARASLPGNVLALVAGGDGVWAGLDGQILRLDPVSLAVLARADIPVVLPLPPRSNAVYSLALGGGTLWAEAGDARHGGLFRLDPISLETLGSRGLPGLPGQGSLVLASDQAVWAVSPDGLRRVDPADGSFGPPVHLQDVSAVASHGEGLVAVVGAGSLAQIDGTGRIVALTQGLGDLGGAMAVDGKDAWLEVGAGSILHFILADVPLSS